MAIRDSCMKLRQELRARVVAQGVPRMRCHLSVHQPHWSSCSKEGIRTLQRKCSLTAWLHQGLDRRLDQRHHLHVPESCQHHLLDACSERLCKQEHPRTRARNLPPGTFRHQILIRLPHERRLDRCQLLPRGDGLQSRPRGSTHRSCLCLDPLSTPLGTVVPRNALQKVAPQVALLHTPQQANQQRDVFTLLPLRCRKESEGSLDRVHQAGLESTHRLKQPLVPLLL
mmetsp:Transcript_11011/g.26987  ORF Transcript_11011/g.26987 Transcript_11011/m.26987 type:complete len:227 (-) Transcript_11011:998-1678(-)